ncbi:Stp1/IreP family PP2C-type Ser/Thr phosphatase [Ureibacillus chungkukjangi]|uniref:protein-serine/threonine phosphatase n=1 Tax=Ureibacillus chungkukjangi TaxID=1202712 RepID=A0A318TVR6_9BACL|nr:Stp1/IreP family PP2C-type Ser/Thr phosphatase [Ureibacillus chungkukjangi]MCM3386703.1 Stp1/IreP family PP2C-type Ser/Thr phosphatase [Ureibacillus chungkukjangi]PYF07058.1 protein phosphatase [Ureibacillus chungkukjangi]
MKFTVESDVGRKRMVNEDRVAFFEHPDRFKLAILADGMGGHNAGDVASEMAIEEMKSYFLNLDVTQLDSTEAKRQWMLETIQSVNEKVYNHSLLHESCKGMGTTLIAMLIDEYDCLIGHIGDSRVYYFTADSVTLITKDHSYVNFLVEYGEISEEEAENHPQKNFIVKSLGTESTIEPDFYELQVEDASNVLICSDGLSNKLTTEEMAAILTLPLSIEEKGKKLIQLANDSGGEDNISVILLSNDGEV